MGGYEGKEREEFTKGRHCRCTRNGNRSQEVRVFESAGCTGGSGIERGEEGQVHYPRVGHDQDEEEGGHEGRNEAHFRQDAEGEGQTSKDRREGILREGPEG